MALRVENVNVTYAADSGQPVRALDDVSLEVRDSEFISIIGPSGCGKSTLLHCLAGLMKPTRGSITVDGVPLTHPDPHRAAIVFQDQTLLPWKTVVENAGIGLRFAGVAKATWRGKAEEILAMVGLSDWLDAYPKELSGGMQQRVAVARAMCMDPGFLLMDEPFGALDEQTRHSLGAEMSEMLTHARRGVVMVTHSLDEAITWADRIFVFSPRPGRIIREIRVNDPRPRGHDFLATPGFGATRAELFSLLESAAGRTRKPAGDGQPSATV